jgi:hypothetical protein
MEDSEDTATETEVASEENGHAPSDQAFSVWGMRTRLRMSGAIPPFMAWRGTALPFLNFDRRIQP